METEALLSFDQVETPNVSFWKDFVAGSIGGAVGVTVGHPVDTVKVRQQALGEASSLKCFTKTFQYEGVRGFFKGMAFPAFANGVFNSIFFGVYANSLRFLQKESSGYCHQSRPNYWNVYIAGCLGGAAQLVVACPVDLVKIRLQAQTGLGGDGKVWKSHFESNLSGPAACIRNILKTQGVKGLYRGLGVMVLRDVPSFGLYVVIYESICDRAKAKGHADGALLTIMAGGLAGSISWAAILPLDVIKSKIQADNPSHPQYKGIVHCAITCYRTEGISVFGRGFAMMVLRAFPTNAATFWAYKTTLDFLN